MNRTTAAYLEVGQFERFRLGAVDVDETAAGADEEAALGLGRAEARDRVLARHLVDQVARGQRELAHATVHRAR